jgi:hypothetical protein
MEPRITLLTLGVDDLERSPARETHWGGYVGYFAAPDGHVREIAWNPHFRVE